MSDSTTRAETGRNVERSQNTNSATRNNENEAGVNVWYFYKKANKDKNKFFKMLSDFRCVETSHRRLPKRE